MNLVPKMNTNYHNLMNSMALNPVSNNEVIMHINSLKNNSAPGIDDITSKFIKKSHIYMLDPLIHIINLIFVIGKVLSSFKISIVIPVFKKGCKTNITNYRTISIISTFEKITGSSTYQILSDKQTNR